jgi:hypothetical protein
MICWRIRSPIASPSAREPDKSCLPCKPCRHGPSRTPISRASARYGGFSLHAGVDIAQGQRAKLERLCRYVSRPPVATDRLALTSSGQVRYALKTAYRDGTMHIVLEPLELMARLAAFAPPAMAGRSYRTSL